MGLEVVPLLGESEREYEEVSLMFKEMYEFMKEMDLTLDLSVSGDKTWINSIRHSLDKLNMVFVAKDAEQLIGFAAGSIRLSPAFLGSKKIGYISHVYVRPKFRKSMIGKQLATELEKWLLGKNVDHIELEVLVKNEKALNFWQQLGYVVDNIRLVKK